MNIFVLPLGTDANVNPPDVPRTARVQGPSGTDGAFATVYEASVLQAARAARHARVEPVEEIPQHLLDEIDAASRLFDELTARDQRVRFDVHSLNRRVVADLVDGEGNVLRPISLGDIVASNDPDAAA